MLKLLFILLLSGGDESEYDAVQRYNDSLLIYNTYMKSAELFVKLKQNEIPKWYALDAEADRLTACAKVRLGKFNRKPYNPVAKFEIRGVGITYVFPKPSLNSYETPQAFTKDEEPDFYYSVYDKQTHFLKTGSCALSTPYIQRYIFDKARLLNVEKLDPVTLRKF